MAADIDRFPDLGPRRRLERVEQVIDAVRAVHPKACAEGSTGGERTWHARDADGVPRVCAHHWIKWGRPGRSEPDRVYLRIAADLATAPPFHL